MGYYLVYVSTAVQLFSRADLDEILAQSYTKNLNLDISGALLYKGGNVMQVLEGERSAVRALYSTIAADPRHKGLITLVAGQQQVRQFGGWSMAFRDLDALPARSHPGYSDFLNTRLSSAEFSADPTKCRRLLLNFKATM